MISGKYPKPDLQSAGDFYSTILKNHCDIPDTNRLSVFSSLNLIWASKSFVCILRCGAFISAFGNKKITAK